MQPRTWMMAALVLAWVNMAEPIILESLVAGAAVAGGAAALLGAATLATGAVGAGVIGAGAIGAASLGAAGAVGAGAVGAAALGAGTVGLAKVGLTKVGLATVLGAGHHTTTTTTRHHSNERYGSGGTITITKTTSNRRYRRSQNGFTNAQELLLANAFVMDQEKPCGLRLVCELATRGPEELEEDERLILHLLEQPHSRRSMAAPYDDAAALGRSSSVTQCAEVYQRCGLNSVEVMQLLRETFTS